VVPGHAGRLRRLHLSGPVPGKVVGPSFSAAEVPEVIEAVLDTYRRAPAARRHGRNLHRHLRRVGIDPFKAAANGARFVEPSGNAEPHAEITAGAADATEQAGTLVLANDADPSNRRAGRRLAHRAGLPKFTDGRAFSQAFLLRRRTPRLRGDIRATGDVLIDQLVQMQRTGHLDALEEEAIFILREVAGAFERPTLLFSGGKDSLVLLKCAEKAFGVGRIPYPLLMIDTGHNFPEVTDFRDFRAKELGAELIVRSVEDSMKRGTVRLAHPGEAATCTSR
jgi:hypothetical protein